MGGGPSQQTQEQQQLQLESSQQQLQFNNQLMALFTKQYNTQQSTLQYLQGQLKPIIEQSEAGQGMSTAALNAMRTSATDALSSEYRNAQQALNQQEAQQMGGTNILPSGTRAQLDAALLNSEAEAKAGTQNQITEYNQNLATSNLWNAFNVYQGNTAMMNPLGYANAATSGGSTIAEGSNAQSSLQNAITNANNSSFFGQFMHGVAGGLGDAFNSGMMSFAG